MRGYRASELIISVISRFHITLITYKCCMYGKKRDPRHGFGGKRPCVRLQHRWEDNIKINF
jgi:hypothetical protein